MVGELARPVLDELDLKQEAELNVKPFTFKLIQLTALVDLKSLENLEILGGVKGLLCGLGVNRWNNPPSGGASCGLG